MLMDICYILIIIKYDILLAGRKSQELVSLQITLIENV